ncbi:MAG: hypothetical protein ACPH5P_09645 [Akkermansiaceae bacterium]
MMGHSARMAFMACAATSAERVNIERLKAAVLSACFVALAACSPVVKAPPVSGGGRLPAKAGDFSKVPEVSHVMDDMREVLKAKVGNNEVVAMLQWRPYNGLKDAYQNVWYGDMGSPPPVYVAQSLIISINGRGLMVPDAKTRYLCSQWMNDNPRLGLYLRGEDLCVFVRLGDGSQAWVASYIVNPQTGALLAHQVQDARSFRKAVRIRE